MEPKLIWRSLLIFNDALCLEPAWWVLTNKEKIKDHQVTEVQKFIFRFLISLVPSMHLLQGRCDVVQLYTKD
jgi:hypothetical protein